jgi:heptosyltransferase-2
VIINDKSPVASGIMSLVRAREVKGFITDEVSGAIIPATEAARELWEIGLDNHRKFHVNRKSEIHLMAEAVELNPADLVGYELPLQGPENEMRRQRKEVWSRRGQAFVIGLNTGCAATLPYKKLSVQGHRDLIRHMLAQWGDRVQIVLLGGREDTFRNDQIAEGLPVIKSPTDQGLRDGLVSVAACDSVFTGDSLGMHLAIAARVWTVAWFGPTCDHEIDFFGRGLAVRAQVPCSPCWKRSCNRPEMCYDHVDSRDVVAAIESSPTWSTWLALRRNPSHSDAGEDGSLRLYPDSLPR